MLFVPAKKKLLPLIGGNGPEVGVTLWMGCCPSGIHLEVFHENALTAGWRRHFHDPCYYYCCYSLLPWFKGQRTNILLPPWSWVQTELSWLMVSGCCPAGCVSFHPLSWIEPKRSEYYAMLLCKPPVALDTRLQLSIVALLLHWSAQVRHLHNSWYWSLTVTSLNAYLQAPLSQAISYLLLISAPVDQLRTINPRCRMSMPGFSSVIWFWGSEICHCRAKSDGNKTTAKILVYCLTK